MYLAPFASGLRGAESGYVDMYIRGTSLRPIVYSDYSGTVRPVSWPMALDSYGAAVVYLSGSVDVTVYSSTMTTLRSFTVLGNDESSEVVSPSFTGTDYGTAVTGTNKPTTQGAVNDAWLTSAGAPDYEVMFGGAATTLQSAFASGLAVINVKDPTYGATGDGATDDTVAIQAAINATAASSGGIVYFPPGTYKVTDAISMLGNVHLWGSGRFSSAIAQYSAVAHTLDYTGASTGTIRQLYFTAGAANTGTIIRARTADLHLHESYVGSTTNTLGNAISIDNGGVVDCADCDVRCGPAVGSYCVNGASGSVFQASRSTFRNYATNTAATGIVVASTVYLMACSITGGTGAVTYNAVASAGTCLNGTVQGCNFVNAGGGATLVAFALGTVDGTTLFSETANMIPDDVTLWSIAAPLDATGKHVFLGSRQSRCVQVTAPASLAIPADDYDTIYVHCTAAMAAVSLVFAQAPLGAKLTVMYQNVSGGALTSLTHTGVEGVAGQIKIDNMADGEQQMQTFVSCAVQGGVPIWQLTSATNSTALDGY